MSAVAHYISGVLDHDSMTQIVNELAESFDFQPGDQVKMMKGSSHGDEICADLKGFHN